jgi:hypothetical protein
MAVHFVCTCGKPLAADEQYIGNVVRCPSCGAVVRVPGAPAAPAPAGFGASFPPGAPGVVGAAGAGYDLPARIMIQRLAKRSQASLVLGIIGIVLNMGLVVFFFAIGQENRRGYGGPGQGLAIMALFLTLVATAIAITGLVLGAMSLKPANTHAKGQAIAGLVLGIINTVLDGLCIGLMGIGVLAALSRMN